MTILDVLPAMHDRGTFALSRAPFDDAARYGRLLAVAPAAHRCPVLFADHALGSLHADWDPAAALARVPHCDVAAVLADRYPGGCVYHPDCLAPFGRGVPRPRTADGRGGAPAAGRGGDGGGRGGGDAR